MYGAENFILLSWKCGLDHLIITEKQMKLKRNIWFQSTSAEVEDHNDLKAT